MIAKKSINAKNLRIALIWINVTVGVVFLFLLMIAGAMMAYGKLYEGKMFPGTRVLGVRLDGMTVAESNVAIDEAIDNTLSKGISFRYRGKIVTLDAVLVSTDADSSLDLIRYDYEKALAKAFSLGRSRNWIANMAEQMRLRVTTITIPATVTIEREKIVEALEIALKDELKPAKNARLVINYAEGVSAIQIESEQNGVALVTESALDELQKQASDLSFQSIDLSDRLVNAELSRVDIEPLTVEVDKYLNRPNLKFVFEKQVFEIPTSTLASLVTVNGNKNDLRLSLDSESFSLELRKLAKDVESESTNGSLVIKDGKIESFTPGTEGRKIDVVTILDQVNKEWPNTSTFPLITTVIQGSLVGDDPERLGIKDLLGVGQSNFSGSPTNRRKNIARGVELVNGTIIQGGETFSLLKTLGPIDGAHKWLPELVIKGNETKPEYGGGLCQIGTTAFRGALASGMPIVERRNHSYRVRYYEPAGTDATIYEPSPDFKFLNDTNKPILINAYIEDDEIYFEFWGARDGRKVEQTKPRIYNISSPPAMKLVETLDLPPGKKKCTESAHAGADAEFTYTVTYPNGEVKTEIFRSHYRPWQAVCLVGVEKLSGTDAEVAPVSE